MNDDDAIIVKYNNNGEVVWKKSFGGNGHDSYNSVMAVSDGIIAVGHSAMNSFGNGDWEGVTRKGDRDAIIVKYNNNGEVVWKKHFGERDSYDIFKCVTTVSDGIIAVGLSDGSFGSGDWEGVTGKGDTDAIVIKYDMDGNLIQKKNFGGSGRDEYNSVTATSDGIIAAGYSYPGSFGTGDWKDFQGKGKWDAIIIKYDPALMTATGISELPQSASGLTIYPNPTTGQFSILNSQFSIEKVEIFDVAGKIVAIYHNVGKTAEIDASHLQAGVYILKVNGEVGKLIKN